MFLRTETISKAMIQWVLIDNKFFMEYHIRFGVWIHRAADATPAWSIP
jgi:hypothetical protein